MPSTAFTSLPSSMKFTIEAARILLGIPETEDDDAVLAKIDPVTIELIIQIISTIISCLDNQRSRAFARLRNHIAAKPIDRIADNMRINTITNAWLTALGCQREAGDVVKIREAINQAAGGLDEDTLGKIQTELIWLTI